MQNIHNWHNLMPEDVLASLNTTPAGLSEKDASQQLKEFGLNRLPEPPRRGALVQKLIATPPFDNST
jgi:hypothetical protein